MEKTPKIYQALTNIMSKVEAIKKNKSNAQQGFKYRSIDDMFNALHDSFSEERVFITFNVKDKHVEAIEQNGKYVFRTSLLIEYVFTAEDGSSISTTTFSDALDFGDKGAGKALSYALKYVLMQMFLIPTEDTPDNDSENIEINKTQQVKPKQEPIPENIRIQAIKDISEAKSLTQLHNVYQKYEKYYAALKDEFTTRKEELKKMSNRQ